MIVSNQFVCHVGILLEKKALFSTRVVGSQLVSLMKLDCGPDYEANSMWLKCCGNTCVEGCCSQRFVIDCDKWGICSGRRNDRFGFVLHWRVTFWCITWICWDRILMRSSWEGCVRVPEEAFG